MTQTATVHKVFHNGTAEIAVPRKSACGHDCEECAGCGISGSAVFAVAKNPIGATSGEKVVVETSTKQLLGIIYATEALLGLDDFCMEYITAFREERIAAVNKKK